MITAIQVLPDQSRTEYAPNELPYSATLDEQPTINFTAATGSTITYDSNFVYGLKYSLKSHNDTANTEYNWNIGTALQFTATRGGARIVSFEVAHDQMSFNYLQQSLIVYVSINGVDDSTKRIEIKLPVNYADMPRLQFFRFAVLVSFQNGDVVNFAFGHKTDPDTVGGSNLWVDGFCVQFDNRGLFPYPAIYQRPSTVIKLFPIIDFDSTDAGEFNDKTGISFPGAKQYDKVEIVPAYTQQLQGQFSAWVTNTDTITARYTNTTGSTVDPASASYKLIIRKAP